MLFSFGASAEKLTLTPEQFRSYFAKKYAQDFVREFNAFETVGDTKFIFGFLFPEQKIRSSLMTWKEKPKVSVDGATVIFEIKDQAPVKIEVVDLYKQEYKINGKKFVRGWNSNPLVDAEVISRGLRKNGVSLLDLAIPRSEAIVPVLVGAELAVLLAEGAAVEMTASAAAGMAAAGAAESALVKKSVETGTRMAVLTSERMMWAFLKELEKNPAARAEFKRIMAKSDKSLFMRGLAWIGQKMAGGAGTMTNTAVGASVGATVTLTVMGGGKEGLSLLDSFKCALFTDKKMEECGVTKKTTVETKDDAPIIVVPPAPNWCTYSAKTPEIQGAATMKDNKREVYIVRYGSSEQAVRGYRFVIERNGSIDAGTIRQIDFETVAKDSANPIHVTAIRKLKSQNLVFDEEQLYQKSRLDLEKDGAIQDMASKIAERNRILESGKHWEDTVNPDVLGRVESGRETVDSKDAQFQLEHKIASSLRKNEALLRSGCKGAADAVAATKGVQASTGVDADTATTSTANEKK